MTSSYCRGKRRDNQQGGRIQIWNQRTDLPSAPFRMEILKLDAGCGKCVCDLLKYFELRRARSERCSTATPPVVRDLKGVGRLEECELCLEADEELYVEDLFCISVMSSGLRQQHCALGCMYFRILFKFVLGHSGTSSRPPIGAFSSKNPNREACPGAYPHSLKLERSITTR